MSRSALSMPLIALLAVACDPTPTDPTASAGFRINSVGSSDGLTVMSQNLYVGADVDRVIGALATPDPNDDLPALLFAIETLGKTDYPARAAAVADEIARTRPHAVGLQEVSNIDIDLSALGGPVVHLDFLAILQAQLADRGLHYRVAATVQNIEASPFPGISLVDHDVLLVDADRVVVTSAGGQNFAANVGPVAPGVVLKRGWVFARTTIRGEPWTFVSLHAEADLAGAHLGGLRALQLSEVVGTFADDAQVVLLGDFNDEPGSLMHQVVTGGGYADAWAALRPGAIGYTCCHAPDLSDQVATFSQRIDYVFARGVGGFAKIDRFGDVPADRTAGPLYPVWPSDHAGVVATLRR